MGATLKQREVHGQDLDLLKRMLKLPTNVRLPEQVRRGYFSVQRMRHLALGGPLGLNDCMLALHISGALPAVEAMGDDELAEMEEAMEPTRDVDPIEEVPPGTAVLDGSGPWVRGRQYHVQQDGEWNLLKFKEVSVTGQLVFEAITKGDPDIVATVHHIRRR